MPHDIATTLKPHVPAASRAWLEDTLAKTRSAFDARRFFYAFSGASRRFDRRILVDGVASDQLARKALLLALAEQPEAVYLAALEKLIAHADIREAVVLYAAFPDLPCPKWLLPLAREATRSNVVDIFDAIALDNPFPRHHFPLDAWNQLVLKALFIGRPLHRIVGLDERANAALAGQISNLAHERWAAGRRLNAEAWRCCQSSLDDAAILAGLRSLAGRSENEKRALALVFFHSPANTQKLADVRETIDPYLKEIRNGALTWTSLGEAIENK